MRNFIRSTAPFVAACFPQAQPRTQGALRFSTLQFSTREDYPGTGGHFFCRILKMGLGVVVFSVLVVSPIGSFDLIHYAIGVIWHSRSEVNVKAVTLVPSGTDQVLSYKAKTK